MLCDLKDHEFDLLRLDKKEVASDMPTMVLAGNEVHSTSRSYGKASSSKKEVEDDITQCSIQETQVSAPQQSRRKL